MPTNPADQVESWMKERTVSDVEAQVEQDLQFFADQLSVRERTPWEDGVLRLFILSRDTISKLATSQAALQQEHDELRAFFWGDPPIPNGCTLLENVKDRLAALHRERDELLARQEAWVEAGRSYLQQAADANVLLREDRRLREVTEAHRSAQETALRALREGIAAITRSDATPIHSNHIKVGCDWCLAEWPEPPHSEDNYPALFGHPENGCIALDALTDKATT